MAFAKEIVIEEEGNKSLVLIECLSTNSIISKNDSLKVIPGGQSIGILVHAKGLMVIDTPLIVDKSGKKISPAKKAGIKVGDIVLSLNEIEINNEEKIQKLIQNEENISVKIKRGNKTLNLSIKPIYSADEGEYKLGLLVKDGIAGVGTLSFYEPESKAYGALGHVINDGDNSSKIELEDGKIVSSSIQSIKMGKKGDPGEKVGILEDNQSIIGSILTNSYFGIFGEIEKITSNPYYPDPILVASVEEIKKGSAEILTVIEGNKIEKFEIDIQKVKKTKDGKDLVIEITDPRLLKATGGIVQGMSGSPIIQNGKMVGAVTHVFVNDPTRGYGILTENMLTSLEEVEKAPNAA